MAGTPLNYGGEIVPLDDDATDPTGDVVRYGESVTGRHIQSFATASAWQAKLDALDSGNKPGNVAHLQDSNGLFWWNGSAQKRIGSDLLTYTARAAGTTQPTGLLLVNFETPFANTGALPRVSGIVHEITDTTNPYVVLRLYKASGYLNYAVFHLHAVVGSTGANYQGYIEFAYTASGPRPSGT